MIESLGGTLAQEVPLLAGSALTGLWEGAALVVLTGLCLRLLPALSAGARWLVWSVVFLLTALLPVVALLHGGGAGAVAGAHVQVGARWAVALVAAWAMLTMYRAVGLLRSALHLRRIARQATTISLPEGLTAELAAALNSPAGTRWSRRVELCASAELDVPSVAGFLRPRILLPAALLQGMSPMELEQVVLHEREHLRRRDDWTNLLQKLALTVFPLSPALFWLERRLCCERELACDDGVLRQTGARKAYATCLANLAERSSLPRRLSLTLALGAWQRRSELARRVERILSSSQRERKPGVMALSAVLVFAVVGGGATMLARMPQMISFGNQASTSPAEARAESPMRMPGMVPAGMSRSVGLSGQTPHATLVNAVMAEHRATEKGPAPSHVGRRTASRRLVRAATARRQMRTTVSLVSFAGWSQGDVQELRTQAPNRPRLTLAVSQDSQFTYAAVPVRGGWLIVQL